MLMNWNLRGVLEHPPGYASVVETSIYCITRDCPIVLDGISHDSNEVDEAQKCLTSCLGSLDRKGAKTT